jgi:hypothetical protein
LVCWQVGLGAVDDPENGVEVRVATGCWAFLVVCVVADVVVVVSVM